MASRVSSSAQDVFLASRAPDALAVIDVTRLAQLPSDGCILPEGDVIPPGRRLPRPSTGDRRDARLPHRGSHPAPSGPNTVVVIPRTMPGGGISDLVVMTTDSGLAFFDTRVGILAASLGGLGGSPSDLAFRPKGTGFRLYVPSFLRGTLAVVDLPDPFRPEGARVIARLGRVQEGA